MDAYQKYERAIASLCRCRLNEAKKLFSEASTKYHNTAKMRVEFKDINQFNSAVCHFWAGNYDDSASISFSLNKSKNLDNHHKLLLDDLIQESNRRKKGSYWEMLKFDYNEMKVKNFHKDILSLLKNNWYFLPQIDFAIQMRDSCSALGMTAIAKSFDNDLIELTKEKSDYKI